MSEQTRSPLQRARRRIAWRLLPFLCLLYIIAYIDRVNVGYAALAMTEDLGFNAEVYGFGAAYFSSAISCLRFQVRCWLRAGVRVAGSRAS